MAFEVEWFVGARRGRRHAGLQRPGVRHDPGGRAVGLRWPTCWRRSTRRACRSSSSTPSTPPASSSCRSRPPTRWRRPTAWCWCAQTIRAVSRRARAARVVRAGRGRRPGRQRRAPALLGLAAAAPTCSPAATGPYGLTARGESVLAGAARPAAGAVRDRRAERGELPAAGARSAGPAPYQCWGGRTGRRRCGWSPAAAASATGGQRRAQVLRRAAPTRTWWSARWRRSSRPPSSGGVRLPPEVTVDPARCRRTSGRRGCRSRVAEAVAALRADDVLPTALGEPLLEAFVAVRRAEAELFAG